MPEGAILPDARRSRAAPWLIVAATWVGCAGVLPALQKPRNGFDARIYAVAVRSWVGGHSLYAPGIGPRHLGFTYPPFAALVLSCVAWLPAAGIVGILGFVGVLVLLDVVRQFSGRRLPRQVYLAAVPALVLLQPVRDTLAFGQVNLFLMGLVLLDLRLLDRRSRWAGIAVGVAAAIKLTPALFIVMYVAIRRPRAALTAAGTAVLVTGLVAVLDPGTSWDYWFKQLSDTSRIGSVDSATNQALSGLVTRAVNGSTVPTAFWLLVAVPLLVAMVLLTRAFGRRNRLPHAFVVTGLCSQLLSPIGWIHHMVWVAPAEVLLVSTLWAAQAWTRLVITAAIYLIFVSGVPDLTRQAVGLHWSSGVAGVVAESSYCLAALALLALLGTLVREAPVAEGPA